MPIYKHSGTGKAFTAPADYLVGHPHADNYELVAEESSEERHARERAEALANKVEIDDDLDADVEVDEGPGSIVDKDVNVDGDGNVVYREPEEKV